MLSESKRSTRLPGSAMRSASSIRSVPWPSGISAWPPQSSHLAGTARSLPQWWQMSRPRERCSVSRASQRLHGACQPQVWHSRAGE